MTSKGRNLTRKQKEHIKDIKKYLPVNRVLMKLVRSFNTAVIEQLSNCHLYSSRDVLRNFWQMQLITIRFI